MIDTHTHYYLKQFDGDRFTLLQQLRKNNINRVIEAAIGIESNFTMRKYFADEDMVYYGAGIHPLRVAYADRIYGLQSCHTILRELLRTPKTVAVGETGLDYHRNVVCDDDKILQMTYFRMQLELALEYDMPLILHIRDCHEDALDILESYEKSFQGVCHCFIGGADIVKSAVDNHVRESLVRSVIHQPNYIDLYPFQQLFVYRVFLCVSGRHRLQSREVAGHRRHACPFLRNRLHRAHGRSEHL